MTTLTPMEIENKSFELITEELDATGLEEKYLPIIKRAIHTSADFEYAKNLCFAKDAVENAIEALKNGCDIVTDTQMAKSGISKTVLTSLGGEIHCFMSDPDVAEIAKLNKTTRANAAMEKAAKLSKPCIFVIGNAPTALMRLKELIDDGAINPVLVIAVPVGFVNVIESKEAIINSSIPYIVARGRKGGSNVGAAIANALLYMIAR